MALPTEALRHTPPWKGLPSLWMAAVGPLAGVDRQVHGHVRLVAEGLAALRARKGRSPVCVGDQAGLLAFPHTPHAGGLWPAGARAGREERLEKRLRHTPPTRGSSAVWRRWRPAWLVMG